MHFADFDRLDAPAVVGWIQPVILVLVAALSNLTIAQVEAILAVEPPAGSRNRRRGFGPTTKSARR